ncbi:hypothetical protein [Haliovirga abyssi]|uniref:Ribbon-helix-helix protein CopG domain-containing protein n=1 Tax=Haliovirga abyssi TaxID=2996794 RepID=A0AAU9E148_9FUSO|nr:hypothetical protein [Haliovirga abyssi]BDU51672.1 hypothetical protein HLVA_22410 [Haliovirga abyssi]BDU51680.1 hypothetical protein HLVA_22490 [Haliovirga abyssi]
MNRKSIVMDKELWEHLKIFKELHKKSISFIIREAVKKYLEEKTKNDLAYKMRVLTPYVDDKEQEEIKNILSNLTKEDLETGEIIEI